MTQKTCDLHIHSNYSDGTCTPSELINMAEEFGLGAVALCDHNTVDGLNDFLNAAVGKNVKAIPGIEVSTSYQDKELHILALFVKEEYYDEIRNLMASHDEKKEQSNVEMIERLGEAGIKLDYDAIKASTPKGRVNRANVAAAMHNAGYVSDKQEAFEKYLHPKYGFYVEPKRIDAIEAIRFIKRIGAVTVWAHPFLEMNEKEVGEVLMNAVPEGLDGMEVLYSEYDEKTIGASKKLADCYDLLYSGGSDFHGSNKPDIMMGTGKGNLAIPYEYYTLLRNRAD